MIKRNLLKAVMMGLCMAALSTGTAFATESGGGDLGTEVVTPELEALYARQKDIDKILFEDHTKDIEKKGFMVNTTGVVGDVIEIGIAPFSEENADYIYELVGKDAVKVVEFDMSVIYATSEPLVAPEEAPVSDGDQEGTTQTTDTEDGKMEIQIESVTDGVAKDGKAETVSAPVTDNIQTIAATDAENSKDRDGVSTPIIILAIAGGAVLVGGAVLYSARKKENK